MDAARNASNSEAVQELGSIAPYAEPGRIVPIKDLYVQRKWVGYFGGVMANRKNNLADGDLTQLSPDYTDEESQHIWDGNVLLRPTCFRT